MAEMVKKATRESFGEAVTELAAEYPDVVVLDADLAAATQLGIFKKKYPERFFDCGIAECNMIGVAAGSDLLEKIPFAASLRCSLRAERSSRCATRSAIEAERQGRRLHAGISVGEDGARRTVLRISPDAHDPGHGHPSTRSDHYEMRRPCVRAIGTKARATSVWAASLWKASTTATDYRSSSAEGITLCEGTDVTIVRPA